MTNLRKIVSSLALVGTLVGAAACGGPIPEGEDGQELRVSGSGGADGDYCDYWDPNGLIIPGKIKNGWCCVQWDPWRCQYMGKVGVVGTGVTAVGTATSR